MRRGSRAMTAAGWADLLSSAYRREAAPGLSLAASGPFVLLDDARASGGAFLLHRPAAIFTAAHPDEVPGILAAAERAAADGAFVAGYLAYEAAAAFEPRLKRRLRAPSGPLAWFGAFGGCTVLDAVERYLPDPRAAGRAPRPLFSEAWHRKAAGQVLDYIVAGDIYQTNLTFPARIAVDEPLALYAALRLRQRAGWGGVIWTGDDWLLSCSPELFFALDGASLTARPMKGTAARGEGADAEVARRLHEDAKERAENLMIVDLMRNDFSRVARPGSVAVPALFEIETYPTLFQMTSTVTAQLRDGLGVADILAAIFPCGSVTGAPKLRAMEIIAELEGGPRGSYTGSMGFLSPGGKAAFNVLIRTVTAKAGAKSGCLQVGSGIVSDSRPETEWRECLRKLAFAGPPHPW